MSILLVIIAGFCSLAFLLGGAIIALAPNAPPLQIAIGIGIFMTGGVILKNIFDGNL
jgi:hypothetical protein